MAPNKSLPPLSVFAARSSLAMVLALAVAVTNMFGVNMFEWLGTEESQVLDAMEGLLLVASVVWFWFERRAPNRRLVITKGEGHDGEDQDLARRSGYGYDSSVGVGAYIPTTRSEGSGGSDSSDSGSPS